MRKRRIILFISLLIGGVFMAADLPSKGLEPAVSPLVTGPGDYPGDPGTPIGGGLFILLGMSATYLLVKRKKNIE
ncbi:MAG: hypothetical protein PF444_08395 [Bacteroidales bacterium]|jgi:UDP-N-acetylmuramyl pentapeptide phosphotransferase/UDP-N-acetylglucosamine-1-phosphate transferase|nr:hypothetical protein [Bacteroidales bacterium]